MRAIFLFVLLFFASAITLPGAALANQCSCPSISADGKGNSSCSATETGSRCTIDFNRFPDFLEDEAAARLTSAIGSTNQGQAFSAEFISTAEFATQESAEVLASLAMRGETQPFVELLMIYLSVAVASREDGHAVFDNQSQFFRDLYVRLSANAQVLMQAFVFDRSSPSAMSVQPISVEVEELGGQDGGGLTVQVSRGCIEATAGDIWVMYKAFWSEARNLERCGS